MPSCRIGLWEVPVVFHGRPRRSRTGRPREGATLRVEIRPYRDEDAPAVRRVHSRAFGGREDEARLVESLHAAGAAPVSLVAALDSDGLVVGHVLFSPVELLDGRGDDPPAVAGLAPVAVLPEHQGRGIGSRLVRDGLEACRRAGYGAAVVLGEPGYYSRFGFERASAKGLGNEYGADEHFMAVELVDGALGGAGGTVRYRKEFGGLGDWSPARGRNRAATGRPGT